MFHDMAGDKARHFGRLPGHGSKLRHDWLNWDNEYTIWKKAGLEVQASIQFTSEFFAKSTFDDPYQAGYDYGYRFALHFGPTNGSGDVSVMEVGNEPWSLTLNTEH